MNPVENDEDRMLIARARNGDDGAYEDLVRKYQRKIYAFCRRMTGAHQSADDLAQETFIKAFFALSRFKEGKEFFPWVRRIALNNTLNYLKRRKRERPFEEEGHSLSGEAVSGPFRSPHQRLRDTTLQADLEKAVESLPHDQKAVFILKVNEGLSYQEIADLLGIPSGTVMSRLSRARRQLRRILAKHLQGGSR